MDRVREKPKDRGRETGMDSYDDVDWREREKRTYGDRRPNGRASLCEQADYGDQKYERRKGDTFPRMTRPSKDVEGRIPLPIHERERHMGIPKELLYKTERERDRRRYREMDLQSERERRRCEEDLRRNDMRRRGRDEVERRREKVKEFDSEIKDSRSESYPGVNDLLAVRERERDRKDKERDRYKQRDREGRYYSRETESFSDREWTVERHREVDRNRKRDTKSEGDSDGEAGRERRKKDDSKREHKHYRSEGDSYTQQMLDRTRERDRRREREAERRRDPPSQRERETGYQDQYRDPERDGMRESRDKRRDYSDREYLTERRRYKEEEKTRGLEQVELEQREKRKRRENKETERSKHRPCVERTTGYDVEDEKRRLIKDNVEERESRITSDIDEQKAEEKEHEGKSALKEEESSESVTVKEANTGKTKPKFRKMWLEPRTGGERKDSSLKDEYVEREKARERYIQRYRTSKTIEDPEREKGGGAVSREDKYRELEKAGEFMRHVDVKQEEERIACEKETMGTEDQLERENVNDNTEDIDREEGDSRYGSLQTEEGSEGESEGEKDRGMSVDDGFMTVSSGGDDAEEDNFEDCKEFWDGGVADGLSGHSKCTKEGMKNENEDHKGKKEPLKVFCVIGQTLARSKPTDHTDEEATNEHADQDLQVEANVTDEPSEKDGYIEQDIEKAMDDLTLSQKQDGDGYDTKWEEGGSYDQPTHDERSLEHQMIPPSESLDTQQPEPSCNNNGTDVSEILKGEKEGTGDPVEIFISDDAWYTSEERKRSSTAPRLKWAKSMVKEILDPGVTVEKGNTRGSVTHVDTQTITQTEGKRDTDDWREEKELLEAEVELQGGMETESNEESEEDLLDPSSVRHTVSSEGEAESERGKLGAEKTDRMNEVVLSSSSFRDLGNEARIRRRGFRKTVEKHKQGEEDEGVGRDRRTRIFNISDEDDDELCFTWSENDLRKVSESLSRTKKRNSKFFNSQLYQEYSEVVLNREIQLSHSDSIAISRDPSPIRSSSSPNHSPKLPHRPPPPRPPPPLHPYTPSQDNSFKSLAVPQQFINRPQSPRLSISPSSPTLWQDLPGVRTSTEFSELTEDERRLQEVRFEVVTSEASYCRSLDIVVENFVMSKQLNALLSSQDKNCLFSRLTDVRAVSHSFLSQLEERVESDVLYFTLCDIIIKHCPRFRKVYVPYLTNQSYQDQAYQRLMDGNHEFRRVVEKLERNSVCQRLPLRSFLILPFQRITRLKLLVQNIVKRTAPKTKDEALAIKAMKLLEKMIQDSNDSISQMKNIESLVSLNAKVEFDCRTLPLISQSRRLVREGPAIELRDFSLKENERSVYLHLFNDYLLVSLRKEGGRFTVIDHAPVSELRVENCRFKLHSLQKNLFRLHMVNQALLLRTDTQADKLRWISALSRPYPEIDFSAVQDFSQVQCIRAYVAQQPDELNLEKADVLLVHQLSTDGWMEGTRLSDRQRGWAPDSHVETIVSNKAKKRNLLDTMKIATAAL